MVVEHVRWWHYVGIALLSLATLLLELALTRVLSVALWYHFGFLIISTALLGFGTSGIVLALWRRVREHAALDSTLALLALLFGVLTIVCFWLMQHIPFDPFSLLADRRQLLFMPLYYVVISVPFFCSGLALALLFTRGVRQINRLYAFDLFGAGLGCVALAVVMPVFGGSGSVIMAAALGLLAAVIFGLRQARWFAIAAATLGIAACALTFCADRLLPISVTPNKTGLQRPLMYTAWNTFSRIDVIEQLPWHETAGRSARRFVFDAGTAATWMLDLRPDVRTVLPQIADKRHFLSGVAYVGKARPKILIIGSGAGAQVLDGLHFGASAITAVEINPIINDTVTGRMRDFWGGLFEQPEVRLVTEEGRSFVRRSGEQYDAIIAVHTISNAAIASGALSLTENYVLTREAFADYLDHLAPDGVLFFTRPEAQIARLFATGREVLAARGGTDLTTYFYAYRVPQRQMGAPRSSFVAGFLMKKSPFTPAELRLMNEHLNIRRGTREILYSPLEPHEGSIYHTLLTAPDLQAVYAAQAAQLAPATDDCPFFNQHTRWSRINLNTFGDLFTQERLGRLALEDRPVAEVTLIVLLAQSILIAAVCMLLPLMRCARAGWRVPNRWRFLLYFAALGLGFIMIEMALLQRFTLFLGQPVYTFAVVLASLLVCTGAGAYLTERLHSPPRRQLRLIVPLIVATLLATACVTPVLCSVALGLPLSWRVLLSVLVIAPLGMLLGMPFPTGLRIVAEEASSLVPWAWGINGFFTVIGTISALMLGMALGFSMVLVSAAFCYLIALVAIVGCRKAPCMAVH